MSNVKERCDYRYLTFDWIVECLHKELCVNDGFTFRVESGLHWGELSAYSLHRPLNGYAVSVDKSWEVKSRGDFHLAISSYLSAAIGSRLGDDYLGAWIDDGLLYLDIVKVVTTPAEALALAKANSQLAYYDIEKGESVYV